MKHFKFEKSGDDVWLLLDCGHFVRLLEGVEESKHKCATCEADAVQVKPKPKRRARASCSKAQAKRAKKLRDRERREVEEAIKKNSEENPEEVPPGHFFWRGKLRKTRRD